MSIPQFIVTAPNMAAIIGDSADVGDALDASALAGMNFTFVSNVDPGTMVPIDGSPRPVLPVPARVDTNGVLCRVDPITNNIGDPGVPLLAVEALDSLMWRVIPERPFTVLGQSLRLSPWWFDAQANGTTHALADLTPVPAATTVQLIRGPIGKTAFPVLVDNGPPQLYQWQTDEGELIGSPQEIDVVLPDAVLNTDTSTADMDFVVDEDDMASDLATKVPTQQSVKAYVDAHVGWINVLDYGADPTGVEDSSAAFQAAIDDIAEVSGFSPGVGGTVYIPPGEYKLNTSVTLAPNQNLVGSSHGAVKLSFKGTGAAIIATSATNGGTNMRIEKFWIECYGADPAAAGLQVGNIQVCRIDIGVMGAGVGIRFLNTGEEWENWSEGNVVRLDSIQNDIAVVFDHNSMSWSTFDIHLVGDPGQSGILIQNHAILAGCKVIMRGDIKGKAAPNTAYAIGVDVGDPSGSSWMEGTEWQVDLETGGAGGTVGPYTVLLGASGGIPFQGTGTLWFKDYGGVLWQGYSAPNGCNATFSGYWMDETLGKKDPYSVRGSLGYTQAHSLSSSAYNGMAIYPHEGDVFAFLLPNGATAISGFNDEADFGRSHRLEIFFKQPASGAAGTITWPSNVKWAGGTSALSSTNGYVDKVRLTYLPSEATWYGEVLTHYA